MWILKIGKIVWLVAEAEDAHVVIIGLNVGYYLRL